MLFKKEFLVEEAYDDLIREEVIGQRRWSTEYRRVFQQDGKFYETRYSVGNTEYQDEHPYDVEPNDIECKEVFPHQVTITVYK
jgi:hypothetical protein